MRRTYRFLLRLYSRRSREHFAQEMFEVFDELRADRRERGWAVYVRFAIGEFCGAIAGAAGELMQRRSAPTPAASGSSNLPAELAEAQRQVDFNIDAMVHAIANHQFEKARVHSDRERQAREHLKVLRRKHRLSDE